VVLSVAAVHAGSAEAAGVPATTKPPKAMDAITPND
jgi:hypothetical protein